MNGQDRESYTDDQDRESYTVTTTPCAYCGKPTPPERQAVGPWHWPGRGLVTNCVTCAGVCATCKTDLDERGTCPTCEPWCRFCGNSDPEPGSDYFVGYDWHGQPECLVCHLGRTLLDAERAEIHGEYTEAAKLYEHASEIERTRR